MADYKVYYKGGAEIKYFPDDKVLMLNPAKSNKNDFLRMKSKIDTILQVVGTKRVGGIFSLKLDDNFNVNIDEVLKSLGMKGGIEREDAQSMIDDSAKDDAKDETKEQQAQVEPTPQQSSDMPKLEGVIKDGVYHFLFEEFFKPGTVGKKRKQSKRFGKYWKPLELYTGKNKNEIKTEDVLEIRRKFSLKPRSKDRDLMLNSLDKAADYFYGRLEKTSGLNKADEFRERYLSIDELKPEDYQIEYDKNIDQQTSDANISNDDQMSLVPNFDDISYDFDIER